MNKLIVSVIGLALIALIVWWFFGKHEAPAINAQVTNNIQNVQIEVKGGYSPEKVVLKKGVPATLSFTRTDSTSCLDRVIFSDFGINQALPENKTETVKIDTSKAGTYNWDCSMNMFHGKVIVK